MRFPGIARKNGRKDFVVALDAVTHFVHVCDGGTFLAGGGAVVANTLVCDEALEHDDAYPSIGLVRVGYECLGQNKRVLAEAGKVPCCENQSPLDIIVVERNAVPFVVVMPHKECRLTKGGLALCQHLVVGAVPGQSTDLPVISIGLLGHFVAREDPFSPSLDAGAERAILGPTLRYSQQRLSGEKGCAGSTNLTLAL